MKNRHSTPSGRLALPLAVALLVARGRAEGEVRIVRHRDSKEVFAMKKMKKTEMEQKNQIEHIKAERDVLVKARNTWIVDLHQSF